MEPRLLCRAHIPPSTKLGLITVSVTSIAITIGTKIIASR